MYTGFLRRYFGRSSAAAAETESDDVDDLVWICVQILECTHPPNSSFEEIMATAARVKRQRSEAGRSNPPISLPPSAPLRVRHKLRELASALNLLASDEEVAPAPPMESPTVEQFSPMAQASSSSEETALAFENSDKDSGRFPHVAQSSPIGFRLAHEAELSRKLFQLPSNREASVEAPRPKTKRHSKTRSAASGIPSQDVG